MFSRRRKKGRAGTVASARGRPCASKTEMIHPLFCWLGIFLSFGVSFILFRVELLDVRKYFYAPALLLIGLAVKFMPFPSMAANSAPLLNSSSFNFGIEIALLVSLVLYVFSGSALSFSTSNLCYKKIQTKGPYAMVRHPATTFKLIYFFLAFFRYRGAYTFVGFLSYLIWTTIYICRAFVEERFLKKFPDYRDYMKKTRYRFIPRVC